MNLKTKEERKEVKIGSKKGEMEKNKNIKLLREFLDVFGWSYLDMPSLDPTIMVHKILLYP